MLRFHCQGCGRTAPAEESPIGPVRYERTGFGGRRYEADLCPGCETALLARYFGVTPDGRSEEDRAFHALAGPPEMPTYLEETAR